MITKCAHISPIQDFMFLFHEYTVPAGNNINIAVTGALREDKGGQVNGTHQHTGVGLNLHWSWLTIVHRSGDIRSPI